MCAEVAEGQPLKPVNADLPQDAQPNQAKRAKVPRSRSRCRCRRHTRIANACTVGARGLAHVRSCAAHAQLDPKEVARKRAAENKAEARAAQVRRETRGMKSISSLFGKYQCKDTDTA